MNLYHVGANEFGHYHRKATQAEALQYALTCRTCGGSGQWPTPKPDAEFKTEQVMSPERCPDCVDGIPRWAIETVADEIVGHETPFNPINTREPDGMKAKAWQVTKSDEVRAAAVLVVLRDRKETE